MKINYYPETDSLTDSLYIDLSLKTSVESREVSPGIVLDYDAEGDLVKLDLKEFVLNKLPIQTQTISG
jgi:uncharacterized protein YuzE